MLYKKEDPAKKAVEFINVEKEVQSAEEALQGAQDIIAEMVSDEARIVVGFEMLLLEKVLCLLP